MLAQETNLLTYQGATVESFHRYQLYLSVGKIQYLKRAGQINEAGNVIRDNELRRDHHVDREAFLAKQLVADQIG